MDLFRQLLKVYFYDVNMFFFCSCVQPDSEVYHCMKEVEKVFREALHKVLPDWPFYRTVNDREESSSGSETGRRRSRNK